MSRTSINELNTLLKGEHMAIHGYEKYIQKIDDVCVKKQLQTIQMDHKQHAIKIAERIQNLGGHPSDGVGVAGEIGEIMTDIRNIGKKDAMSILETARKSEDIGIRMADEVVKGDLDEESAGLIRDILNDDRDHLTKLTNLIEE